jgi:putative FmdB family regulatory protein
MQAQPCYTASDWQEFSEDLMPWYDYQCAKCAAEFETEHAMSYSGTVKCPACGSARTSKVFSAAAIAFKGSGFYANDSRGASSTSKAESSTKETPAPVCGAGACPACEVPKASA